MENATREKLARCLVRYDEQTLTRADLETVVAEIDRESAAARPPQDLLYLQTRDTSVGSAIVGASMVLDGAVVRAERTTLPYRSVLDAINDGWRVVSFPDLALVLDEHRPQGMGCEFVLEKWAAS